MVFWWWQDYHYDAPIRVFKAQEQAAAPAFDQLNEAVLTQLPPPPTALEVGRRSYGILNYDQLHGRRLIVDYQIKPGTIEAVHQYYRDLLIAQGWATTLSGQTTSVYTADTACIVVSSFSLDADEDTYYIKIWHDFWKQTFSPQPLAPDVLERLRFSDAYRSFADCPP